MRVSYIQGSSGDKSDGSCGEGPPAHGPVGVTQWGKRLYMYIYNTGRALYMVLYTWFCAVCAGGPMIPNDE